jgi:hypothetical protein
MIVVARDRWQASAGRGRERGPQRTEKGVKCEKDVKIDGTNSVKSFRINRIFKKTNSNELKTNWF